MRRRLVGRALIVAGLAVALAAGLPLVTAPARAAELVAEPAAGRAIVPPDDELVVEEVRTDQFPKLTARFTIRPLQGRPPSYLDLKDIAIVNDGVLEAPLEAHTVGRVPTT